ncbi:MAG TPA: aldo/keto reductase [Woeseiaceae bacterium]|jgi:2,5-diketo-D-gluconate reductase A|nr:aldo/keto reductase [Woeseiaceae bacterium]
MDARSTLPLYTGNRMPVFGLGTWQLTKDTANTVARALELGYPLIDTSSDYGTQPAIGEAIRRSGAPRDSFYLVTKVEETDDAYQATRDYIAELGLEFADLMLIHRPPGDGVGAALWEGLREAKQDGLTRDIGVSNYSMEQIRALVAATGEKPVVDQIEWSPFGHSQEMLDDCRGEDIVIQAYSPLTRTKRLDDRTLKDIAERYGKSPAQILIRWNLQRGTVPLPKANRVDHLEEDIDVFDFELEERDLARLGGLNDQYSSLGMLPYV